MKIFKRSILVIVLIVVGYGVRYAWQALPIISAFGAKDLCTCVFLNGRDADDVRKQELGAGLQSLGSFGLNTTDSTVTGTVFGLAKRKAIYRKGLGCTLVSEITEEELRAQKMNFHTMAPLNQDTIPWPMGNILKTTIDTGIYVTVLKEALDFAFTENDSAGPINTRAVVIVYDGQVIAERYARGYDEYSRHMGWSMTKSITNAITGILTKDGRMKVFDPAPIPSWQNDDRKKITLHNLLQASSGLEWQEKYNGPSPATKMIFNKKDMGLYAMGYPLESEPNTVFEYSSGTTNIISRLIREAIGDEDYYRFYYRELFEKIGARSMVIEPDAGGTYVGSSFSWATARDWARFGLLYLNDGVFNGERILPEGWVAYTTTNATAARRGEYGAQWWLNAGGMDNPDNRTYPDVPRDSFQAEGYEGQFVFVVPSKKLVVVRLGLSQTNELDMNRFVSKVIDALPR
ncbi:MAG: serine hydrolase [Cyclobacteriaceae bacterium]|nr:serine hydrolase [Cyclobacteriaceae bacterium]